MLWLIPEKEQTTLQKEKSLQLGTAYNTPPITVYLHI